MLTTTQAAHLLGRAAAEVRQVRRAADGGVEALVHDLASHVEGWWRLPVAPEPVETAPEAAEPVETPAAKPRTAAKKHGGKT